MIRSNLPAYQSNFLTLRVNRNKRLPFIPGDFVLQEVDFIKSCAIQLKTFSSNALKNRTLTVTETSHFF